MSARQPSSGSAQWSALASSLCSARRRSGRAGRLALVPPGRHPSPSSRATPSASSVRSSPPPGASLEYVSSGLSGGHVARCGRLARARHQRDHHWNGRNLIRQLCERRRLPITAIPGSRSSPSSVIVAMGGLNRPVQGGRPGPDDGCLCGDRASSPCSRWSRSVATSTPTFSPSPATPRCETVVSSVALTFFAFLGFGVITFTAKDLRDPLELPRAIYLALGHRARSSTSRWRSASSAPSPSTRSIASGGTALAVAAEPTLGDSGFWLMTVTALFSTAGATNAGLYPAAGLCEEMASHRTIPAGHGPPRCGLPARWASWSPLRSPSS